MSIGDIHWVEMPARGGHAQAGRRPAIVMQGAAGTALPTTLIIPLTTQLEALRFPGTVRIEADAHNGLRRASVALVFQLTAVDNSFVAERMGQVSPAVLESLWAALDHLTARAR